jgi:hypothetical protein
MGKAKSLPFFYMKNSNFYLPVFFFLLTMVSCRDVRETREYLEVAMDRDSLADALESREKEIKDFSVEFEKIENNLLAIDSNKARILLMHDRNDFLGRRDRINALIADIYIALDQNESAIQILEKRLAAEKSRNDFAKVVVVLRKSLKEKVEEIQKLEKEISDLRLQVNNLKEAIAYKESLLASKDTLLAQNEAKIRKQQELLSEKEKQLNRAYLIKGTTKELIKAGIVIRKGGVLGLGAVKVMGQKVPATNLQIVNAKTDKMVLIGPYTKRKVISNHPADSYFFVARDGQLYIKISYPDRFWSLSKYLVIALD